MEKESVVPFLQQEQFKDLKQELLACVQGIGTVVIDNDGSETFDKSDDCTGRIFSIFALSIFIF